MITIGTATEDRWLDIVKNKIRLKVRPSSTLITAAARHHRDRQLEQVEKEFKAIKAGGGSVEGLPDIEDAVMRQALGELYFSQGLARYAILEWEGVCDEAGHPAPVTPENCDELMQQESLVCNSFVVQYREREFLLAAEGNDSAPSPDGISDLDEAAPTASNAGATTPLVPEAP